MPIYNLEFSSDCTTLNVGCYLQVWNGSVWVNADAVTSVVNGKFSDGVYCYIVAEGVIVGKNSCFPYQHCLDYPYITIESCLNLTTSYDAGVCNV